MQCDKIKDVLKNEYGLFPVKGTGGSILYKEYDTKKKYYLYRSCGVIEIPLKSFVSYAIALKAGMPFKPIIYETNFFMPAFFQNLATKGMLITLSMSLDYWDKNHIYLSFSEASLPFPHRASTSYDRVIKTLLEIARNDT